MNDPASKAWFVLELTYGEAEALRNQIGDIPGPLAGPRVMDLYRNLDARLRLVGSIDDGPQLRVIRGGVPSAIDAEYRGYITKRVFQKRPKPERPPSETACPACHGAGLVDGEICAPCRGFGEVAEG